MSRTVRTASVRDAGFKITGSTSERAPVANQIASGLPVLRALPPVQSTMM
jgi:hypothetical protein